MPLAMGSLIWEARSHGTFGEGCERVSWEGGDPGRKVSWERRTLVCEDECHGKRGLHGCETSSRSLPPFFQAMPMTLPRLVVPRFSEVETSWTVDCTLDGLFPASEAQVQLALGDQMLNATVVSHSDTLTATATAKAEQEGTQEIVCNVTLGGESRETRENVKAYSKRGRSQNSSGGKGRGFHSPRGRGIGRRLNRRGAGPK